MEEFTSVPELAVFLHDGGGGGVRWKGEVGGDR